MPRMTYNTLVIIRFLGTCRLFKKKLFIPVIRGRKSVGYFISNHVGIIADAALSSLLNVTL